MVRNLPGCLMETPVHSALHWHPEGGSICRRVLYGMVMQNISMHIATVSMQYGLTGESTVGWL